VLGNHDYKAPHSGELITQTLTKYNIHVLDNDTTFPYGEEEGCLQIVGLGDLNTYVSLLISNQQDIHLDYVTNVGIT
jgi:hypothetical protein